MRSRDCFHLLVSFAVLVAFAASGDSLERGFDAPPDSTKPWCYWYWLSDNISREGITKDLEAMKRVGIGEAFIGNIYLDDLKKGTVKALSEEWWQMVEHAVREGGRIGVNVGLFNCPGWSQSGGPWVKPEQAMRYVAISEQRVKGPTQFQKKLTVPKTPFQEISVIAFPAPREDAETLAGFAPQITCSPNVEHAERLADGDRRTEVLFPPGAGQGNPPFTVSLELSNSLTARSLVLVPARTDFSAQCELQAEDEGGQFKTVRAFPVDRSNNSISVGFVPYGPVAISFLPVTSQRFRLVFTAVHGKAGLGEIELSGAARVERFVEKQLGKMHPTPLPMWDAYLWPATASPGASAFVVDPSKVVDLTTRLGTDGVLRWAVPEGEWVVLDAGMTPTGTKNSPASPEGQGLEVDKMNAVAAKAHFDAYVGELLRRMPKADRKALRHVVADSYEMGSQDWTDGMRARFRARYGYYPQPWLPVLTGRIVGGAEQSDRFLWDLRRLVADQVATQYVGGLREACRRNGLTLWLENYGHWGFPAEFLQYGGQSDEVSGEFWATGDLGSIELRCASSAAHTYGKPVVHAEAFTSALHFESTPWSLKQRGDWALTEGINHWVLHVYIHQPWDDRLPGVNAWFSTEFNRNNTWFYPGKEWIDYYRRCDFLLQQGRHVADIAYFIGEDTPKMTGIRKPELPAGYDFDYINAEVIGQRLKVKNGKFVLPDGMSYRVLVLPELETMRPELLKKIRDLVRAGGTVLGNPPLRSPSLQNFPACDEEVQKLANELWSKCDGKQSKESHFGKGRVFRNVELTTVLDALGIGPDVANIPAKKILWTHRAASSAGIFFLSNQGEEPAQIAPVFRVAGKVPEFWDAAAKQRSRAAAYRVEQKGIQVPIDLAPRGSVFVLFRKRLDDAPVVKAVRRGEEVLLDTEPTEPVAAPAPSGDAGNNFTMAGWLKPAVDIALPEETNSGVFIHLARNDAVAPVHGTSALGQPGHSCAGISAGQNGICVYEHAADYFAPLLVAPARLTNWTHVAVVYSGGRPRLYVNGKLQHEGLQSRYTVHSSLNFDQSAAAAFQGRKSGFTGYDHALSAVEIVALAARPPEIGHSCLPPIALNRGASGKVEAEISAPGAYEVTFFSGRTKRIQVRDLPEPREINGPWEVRFPSGLDEGFTIALEQLASLTEHPNPAVRYFSGTATYSRSLQVPAPYFAAKRRILLDLGAVEAMAEVMLNGRNLGVLWKPPFLIDITAAAKPGANALEVRVTGTWHNRLIGAAKYPNGFPAKGQGGASKMKPYLTADLKLSPDAALTPFGLLGPVRVMTTERLVLADQ